MKISGGWPVSLVEVGVVYTQSRMFCMVIALILLAILKRFLVAWNFMHLRFEKPPSSPWRPALLLLVIYSLDLIADSRIVFFSGCRCRSKRTHRYPSKGAFESGASGFSVRPPGLNDVSLKYTRGKSSGSSAQCGRGKALYHILSTFFYPPAARVHVLADILKTSKPSDEKIGVGLPISRSGF